MSDAMQVVSFAFDLSDEEPTTDYSLPEREWAQGSQPIAAAWDDDVVQVMIDPGVWCRQAVAVPETACGTKIDYRLSLGLRGSSYLGVLCVRGCFSKHELEVLAPRARALDQLMSERDIKKLDDDRRKMFDELRANRPPKK